MKPIVPFLTGCLRFGFSRAGSERLSGIGCKLLFGGSSSNSVSMPLASLDQAQ
jgi:hypothetical protein